MYLSQSTARKLAQEILPGLNVQVNCMGYHQVFLPIGRGQHKLKLGYGYGKTWEEALESAKETKLKLDKQNEDLRKDKEMVKEAVQQAISTESKQDANP